MPGAKDHWVVRSIAGEWTAGFVRGFAFDITWGPAEGYEGFMPDDDGNSVPVMVLVSDKLEKNWPSIDDYHGDGFVRKLAAVTLDDESVVDAWVYLALTDS